MAMSCDEAVVIMSSIRYALGRSSYAVGCVCDYAKFRKPDLSQSNIEVIERDVLEYIEKYPDISYKQDWLDLIEYLKK